VTLILSSIDSNSPVECTFKEKTVWLLNERMSE